MIDDINHAIPNPRAKNQHGMLCSFSKPCSFFIKYGRFPTIEDYLTDNQNNSFDFKKLSLKRSPSSLDFLVNTLISEGIIKSYIYPD